MKQKLEQLNGFEYTHERHNFNGQWVFFWRFKPIDQPVWCPFTLPSGNAKKADVISLLTDKESAANHYKVWLDRASDVEAAQLRLSRARSHLERISDPNWGGSGSNPDKDARITRQARSEMEFAERDLESAIRIREQITN
ncbi:hypothetical protein BvCmsA138A_04215 [Escherichia coli]|uniref:hypothetical protein n=1 Tax=Enterobacteriaceae TaxID=543 RepID=UPI0010B34C0A|nr:MULTISPECIES: hypothetical protein [Enterobacteriaceae]UKB63887.1 hypothetical protein L3068_17400 [Enterobacter cloacae complex sp. ECL414]GCJ07791.1 hypothetical protein BvCmsA138A_04215 [Escherichia coli]HCM9498355.1 hypothetical protein [Enterobacter asburiae]